MRRRGSSGSGSLFGDRLKLFAQRLSKGTSFDFVCAGGEAVKSLVSKRSIVIAGHKTSVSLEDEFWSSLKEIAGQRGMTLTELVGSIDRDREHANLSSAIRLFVLGVYRDRCGRVCLGMRFPGQWKNLGGLRVSPTPVTSAASGCTSVPPFVLLTAMAKPLRRSRPRR